MTMLTMDVALCYVNMVSRDRFRISIGIVSAAYVLRQSTNNMSVAFPRPLWCIKGRDNED